MKKISVRIISIILVALMLPVPSAFASGDMNIVRVCACGLFSGEQKRVFLLETEGGYYITPEAAASLAGLEVSYNSSGGVEFSGYHQLYAPLLIGIERMTYDNEVYYALEPLMDSLETYIISNGDSNMYYNSVPENTAALLKETDRMLSDSYYNADPLEDLGFIGDDAYTVAVVADIVCNIRLDALWGKAYEDDIAGMFLRLLQPDEDEVNLFSAIQSVSDPVSLAVNVILAGQSGYDSFKEKLLELPIGSDYLLFGYEGTERLREALEASQAVDKGDFFDLYFKGRLGYSTALEYEQSVAELGKQYDVSVNGFGLSDLLKLGEYVVGTTHISEQYALALQNIVSNGNIYTGNLLSQTGKIVIRNQAVDVLGDYWSYQRQNTPGLIAGMTADVLETTAANVTSATIEKALFENGSWAVALFAAVLQGVGHIGQKQNAVRDATRYRRMQELFSDCYDAALSDGAATKNALLLKDATLLYLKSAWNSYDGFSFDDGENLSLIDKLLDSAGTPVSDRMRRLQEELLSLTDFPDEMFLIVKNDLKFSVNTFGRRYFAGQTGTPYETYYELLQNHRWLDYAIPEYGVVPASDYFTYDCGSFCIYDVNGDGTDELVIITGDAMANGVCLVFTCQNGSAVCAGGVAASLLSVPLGKPGEKGLLLSEYHGGLGSNTLVALDSDWAYIAANEELNYDAGDKSSFADWQLLEVFPLTDASVPLDWGGASPAKGDYQEGDSEEPGDDGEFYPISSVAGLRYNDKDLLELLALAADHACGGSGGFASAAELTAKQVFDGLYIAMNHSMRHENGLLVIDDSMLNDMAYSVFGVPMPDIDPAEYAWAGEYRDGVWYLYECYAEGSYELTEISPLGSGRYLAVYEATFIGAYKARIELTLSRGGSVFGFTVESALIT